MAAAADAPRWGELRRGPRLVLATVMAGGLAVALAHLVRLESATLDGSALLFIVLAVATGSVTVRLPRVRASISLDTVFVLALVLTGAAGAAVLVSGATMAIGELRSGERGRPWHTLPFNFGTGALAAQAAALGVTAGRALLPQAAAATDVAGAAFGYWAANVGLVALAISRTRGVPLAGPLRALAWTFPAFLGAGSLAALLGLALGYAPLLGLLATPLIVVLYAAFEAQRERVEEARRHAREVEVMYLPTVTAIVAAIEARNAADGGHHARVQALALVLAEELGVEDPTVVRAVRFGALLHDVGRIALPDSILMKEEALTAGDRRQLELHPVYGAELIRHIPFSAPVAETIRHHHERWDGRGYPEGLGGRAIPLSARLVAVAEVFDSVAHARPGREALGVGAAVAAVEQGSGSAFDPRVAATLRPALSRLGWSAAHPPGRSEAAIDAIARGAVSHALELRLSKALRAATSFEAVLATAAEAVDGILPVDGWALVPNVEDGRAVAFGVSMESLVVATASIAPEILSSAPGTPRPELLRAGAPVDDGEGPGRQAVVLSLRSVDGWRGVLAMRLAGNGGELLTAALAKALARPLADAFARVWRVEQGARRAARDPLTGLGSRLALDDALAELRTGQDDAVAVLLLDLDGFKGLNDHFGHQAGDEALRRAGAALLALEAASGPRRTNAGVAVAQALRAFRSGGDEFVLLSARPDALDAVRAQVRAAVEAVEVDVGDGEYVTLRASVGAAAGRPGKDSLEALIEAADRAMYEDKRSRPDRLARGARPRTRRRPAAGVTPCREGPAGRRRATSSPTRCRTRTGS